MTSNLPGSAREPPAADVRQNAATAIRGNGAQTVDAWQGWPKLLLVGHQNAPSGTPRSSCHPSPGPSALRPGSGGEYPASMASTHLVVLGNAGSVHWVLGQQRMAFTEVGMRGAARLGRGDHLIFYISLKCWPELGGRRPASGLLIGSAVVLTDVRRMERPVLISGRRFLYSCELFFERLAELGSGVPIGPLKEELDLTAGKSNYGQALQRTPVLLSPHDTELLARRLSHGTNAFEDSVDTYFAKTH